MKKAICCLLALLTLAVSACGMQYRADVPMSDLLDRALGSVDPDVRFVRADRSYLDGYFPLSEEIREGAIYYAADGNNLDEFGVFYSSDPRELAEDLQEYLADCLEENVAFYDSYIPEQTPKLRDARVRIFGDCVVYAILSPTEQSDFFHAMEEALRM